MNFALFLCASYSFHSHGVAADMTVFNTMTLQVRM